MEKPNNILCLVDQSISAAETKQISDSNKKHRKAPHPLSDKKRIKSDSEEEKSDSPSCLLFGAEPPAVQGDLASQLTTYRFLDQNI